jgi:adenylylsulfate kinase-like enzyme
MNFLDDQTRYALWLVGPSGSGKSFVAKFLSIVLWRLHAGGARSQLVVDP